MRDPCGGIRVVEDQIRVRLMRNIVEEYYIITVRVRANTAGGPDLILNIDLRSKVQQY